MKKAFLSSLSIFIALCILSLSGCETSGVTDASKTEALLLKAVDTLSQANSYELATSRVEDITFGTKHSANRTQTEQKLILKPFTNWSRTDSTSTRVFDGSQYRSIMELYQTLKNEQLTVFLRSGSDSDDSGGGKEPVLGEWKKISELSPDQTVWATDAIKSNFDAQLYLLRSNLKTFKAADDKETEENILKYDGYLEQSTVLEAYKKYIRGIYVKTGMLQKAEKISAEALRKEIIEGDYLEIKAGIPRLAYSDQPVPVSLWLDRSTSKIVKATVDETSVVQCYLEQEALRTNQELKDPAVVKAILTYEIKNIDNINVISMPK